MAAKEVVKDALKVVMFLGSARDNRLCTRVYKFVHQELIKSGHDVTIFDPLELDLPVLRQAMAFVKDWTTLPESLVKANETLVNSDAIIVISPEYNHSIPPALSNLLDHFPLSSYKYKVSGIVCYSPGPYGGMRAAMQLRCLLGELGTVSVPNIFGIPHASQALNENGEPLNDHMASGAKKLITQVDWYSEALRAKKEKDGIPS
jgi:NAD(P)H-dependent FMN reductase